MDPRYPVNYPKIRNRWYRPSAYHLVLAYGGRFIVHRNNSFSFSLFSFLPSLFLPSYLLTFLPSYLLTFLPSYLLTFLPSSFPPLLSIAQRNVALRAPNKGFGNQPSESKQHSTHEAVKLSQAALIP